MSKEKLTDEDKKKLREEMETKSEQYTEEDVKQTLDRKSEIEEKLKKVPEQFRKMIKQVKLLFELLGDYWKGGYREIPWKSIAAIVFAITYFASPVDLISDFIPVFGFIDDAFVFSFVMDFIRDDLKIYCQWKEYDENEYF